MLSPELGNSRGNWQVIGFGFLPPDLTIWQAHLFGFRKFQHVLVWVKYANMTVVERVGLCRSALFGYWHMPIAVSVCFWRLYV